MGFLESIKTICNESRYTLPLVITSVAPFMVIWYN